MNIWEILAFVKYYKIINLQQMYGLVVRFDTQPYILCKIVILWKFISQKVIDVSCLKKFFQEYKLKVKFTKLFQFM